MVGHEKKAWFRPSLAVVPEFRILQKVHLGSTLLSYEFSLLFSRKSLFRKKKRKFLVSLLKKERFQSSRQLYRCLLTGTVVSVSLATVITERKF